MKDLGYYSTFFGYHHLPKELQNISYPFCELGIAVLNDFPNNEEKEVVLRKLLEAKDAAVRCFVLDRKKI